MNNRKPNYFRLAECPSSGETGGLSFDERYHGNLIVAVKSGEFRPPKRDEWYLSGAIPEGYKAKNNLSTPFHILKLARLGVQTVVTETVTPL